MKHHRVGDRVRVWIGPPKRGGYRYGTVTGIDDGSLPGVRITFDAPVLGQPSCYATHDETEQVGGDSDGE